MENLPVDFNHPAMRDYLALVRLQVLTPLSLLIVIATLVICAVVTEPTIPEVARQNPTAISPQYHAIVIYVILIFVGQLGYCILLVLASKPETKRALIRAVGLPLVAANGIMAFWALTLVFQWFLAASILQGFLLLLLLYSNIALLIYHPPTRERPLDIALIHAPLRFFLGLPMMILFPYCLFVTLGLSFDPDSPGEGPRHYSTWHAWLGFAVVMPTNFVALLVIILRRDLVFCIAATWICISIWLETPKPAPVKVTVIVYTVLHPLGYICSHIYSWFYAGRSRRVALRGSDDALHRHEGDERRRNGAVREINPEEAWNE